MDLLLMLNNIGGTSYHGLVIRRSD